MQRGHRTSEFWVAAFWSVKAALAVAALLAFSPRSWPLGLCVVPPVCLLIYFAGVNANNYSENRFRLKAQRRAIRAGESPPDNNPGKTFIFGRHVATESNGEGREDDG